jgi:hypothetical protein
MDPGRSRLIAVVVLVVASAGLIAIAVAGSGGTDEPTGLKVELAPGGQGELIVSVPASTNVPDTAEGRETVTLECSDGDDRVVVRARQPWPFTDTDADATDPHVHQFVDPRRARRIARCRLPGTKGPLEGRLSGVR